MADVKISALPSATTPLAGTEEVPVVQSATTTKTTINDIVAKAPVQSVAGKTGTVTLTPSDVGAEPADATILKSAAIGVTVQAYNANTVVDASYVHTDNNYTTTEKSKLAGIAAGAEVNVNADWNAISGDAQILNKPTIPSKTSDLTNDSGFITSYTETDPIFSAHPAHNVTSTSLSQWNTAYGWGNHATAGYLDSADIGSSVQAYDSNLTGFVSAFTLPTTDGTSGQVLTTNGSGALSFATPAAGYTNSDVDAHLNTSTATSGKVLSWNGTDYNWISASGGGVPAGGTTGQVLAKASATDYDTTWVNQSGGGSTAGFEQTFLLMGA